MGKPTTGPWSGRMEVDGAEIIWWWGGDRQNFIRFAAGEQVMLHFDSPVTEDLVRDLVRAFHAGRRPPAEEPLTENEMASGPDGLR